MPAVRPLAEEELNGLRQFDTCIIANAVEAFNCRLRNTGFTSGNVRCIFPNAPPMVGHAVTARLSSAEPPIGGGTFHDRGDLWKFLLQSPSPRILVLQDMDDPPGRGAFVGDMHSAILKALGCVAYITNGAVRELPPINSMGLKLFAGNVSVSHAYAHLFDLGAPVTIDGMEVHTGDLLHGDRHGILSIPPNIGFASGSCCQAAAHRAKSNRLLPIKWIFGRRSERSHEKGEYVAQMIGEQTAVGQIAEKAGQN